MDTFDADDIGHELLKCVVVGDTAVGKTRLICSRSLQQRMTLEQLMNVHIPTVWAIDQYRISKEVLQRSYETIDGTNVSLRLWDTFGDHQNDRRFAYGRTDVVVVCFSIANRRSLQNVRTLWHEEIRRLCALTVPVILVGCKIDLRYLCYDDEFQKLTAERRPLVKPIRPSELIFPDEGRSVAEEIGASGYYETSVLTQYGVRQVFENAARAALRRRRQARFFLSNTIRELELQAPFLSPRPAFSPAVANPSTYLDDMRSNALLQFNDALFSDVIVRLKTTDFYCHRLILAASSPVFRQLFVCQQKQCAECGVDAETPTSSSMRRANFTCGFPSHDADSTPEKPLRRAISAEDDDVIGADDVTIGSEECLVQHKASMIPTLSLINEAFEASRGNSTTSAPPVESLIEPTKTPGSPPKPVFLRVPLTEEELTSLPKFVLKTLSHARSSLSSRSNGAGSLAPTHNSGHSLSSAVCHRQRPSSAMHQRRWPPLTDGQPLVPQPFLAVSEEEIEGKKLMVVVVDEDSGISEASLRAFLRFCYAGILPDDDEALSDQLCSVAVLLGVDELVNCHLSAWWQNQLQLSSDEYPTDEPVSAFLSKRNAAIVELGIDSSLFCDVRFELADGAQCGAHRFLLCARSDVMQAMFTGQFSEGTSAAVRFLDVGQETFQCFLQYVYTDSVTLLCSSLSDYVELLELGNRLCLPRLRSLVEVDVVGELTSASSAECSVCEDALQLLEPAQMCNAAQLADWCLTYLRTHYDDACKQNARLLQSLSIENRNFLEAHRWPPSWYLKEYARYERAMLDLQTETLELQRLEQSGLLYRFARCVGRCFRVPTRCTTAVVSSPEEELRPPLPSAPRCI